MTDKRDIRIRSDTDYKEFLKGLKSNFQVKYKDNVRSGPINYDKIEKQQVLGLGAFGIVYLVRSRVDGLCYAMKQSLKANVVKQNQVQPAIREKRLLAAINFPFLVYLNYAFKDNDFIYTVMPFINGGELFSIIRKEMKLTEAEGQFFGSQVVLGLEYLHTLDIVYRDLKPENILIDYRGYLRIADLGFCKIINGRTYTLCGTPEYLAPEIIKMKGYGFAADWWAFGVLMFEICVGVSPFYIRGQNEHIELYGRILDGQYTIPPYCSSEFKDLVTQLMQSDVSKRIGNLKYGADDIKSHTFFQFINWVSIFNKEVAPHFVPKVSSECDPFYFDHNKEPDFPKSRSCQFEREFLDF